MVLKGTDDIMLLSEARTVLSCIKWIGFAKQSPVLFGLNKS